MVAGQRKPSHGSVSPSHTHTQKLTDHVFHTIDSFVIREQSNTLAAAVGQSSLQHGANGPRDWIDADLSASDMSPRFIRL